MSLVVQEDLLTQIDVKVQQRLTLEREIAEAALDAQQNGATVRQLADVLGVAPSTALEFLNRSAALLGPAVLDDTVIVAATWAYDLYLDHGVYACQPDRPFRNARWMGFYRAKTIECEIAQIMHVEPCVHYTRAYLEQLGNRGGRYDAQLAAVGCALVVSGARPAGGRNQLVLLAPPRKQGSFDLARPIMHTGYGAWTRWQRYVSSAALRRSPATTADLARLMKP